MIRQAATIVVMVFVIICSVVGYLAVAPTLFNSGWVGMLAAGSLAIATVSANLWGWGRLAQKTQLAQNAEVRVYK